MTACRFLGPVNVLKNTGKAVDKSLTAPDIRFRGSQSRSVDVVTALPKQGNVAVSHSLSLLRINYLRIAAKSYSEGNSNAPLLAF